MSPEKLSDSRFSVKFSSSNGSFTVNGYDPDDEGDNGDDGSSGTNLGSSGCGGSSSHIAANNSDVWGLVKEAYIFSSPLIIMDGY